MLPSWLEQVRISIHPEGLDGVVVRRGDKRILRRERMTIPVTISHDHWVNHLAMLPDLLSALMVRHRETRVVVSNALVHFLVHPWQEALGSDEEWHTFSQHAFTNLYGQNAETWRIRLAMQGYGKPVVACAMENRIAESINNTLMEAGTRITGIEPFFNASFNRYRKQFQDDECWLALMEPTRLSLGRIQGGALVQMTARRMGGEPEEAPALVLRRELERCTDGNSNTKIFFHVAGDIAVPEGLIQEVSLLNRDRRVSLSDAGLAIALC